jgi:hypothetical protein
MGNKSQNRFGRPNENTYWRQKLQKEKEKRDIEKPFCCIQCNFRGTEDQAKKHDEKMQIQLIKAFKKLNIEMKPDQKCSHKTMHISKKDIWEWQDNEDNNNG